MSAYEHRVRSGALRLPAIDRSTAAVPAAMAVLTIAAFVLRISQIHQSLLGDEVFTYQDISGRSFGAVLTTVHTGGENSPPLFFLLAWLTAKLGDPTVWLRLPSVVLSAATVPVICAIGRRTVGTMAGLVAAALFALSPFTVYYGVEARPYATMTFFVAVSTLALLTACRTRETRWWVGYVLSATAAAYTHYTAIFVLVVQGTWALWWYRDRIRAPLIASGLAVLLYLPWLPQLRGKQLAVIGFLYPLSAGNVVKDWIRSLFGYVSASLTQIPGTWGLALIGACIAVALASVLRRSRHTAGMTLDLGSPIVFLLTLALATPIGLVLYSITVTDLWLPRGLSASIPAACLVIGALLVSLPRRGAALAVAAMLATLSINTIKSFGPNYVREPYRAMAAYLDRVARPQDRVLVASIIGQPAIAAMARKPHPIEIALPQAYRRIAPGSLVYVVIDDHLAQVLHVSAVPPLGGFRLIYHVHYRGSLPTELLLYRRLG